MKKKRMHKLKITCDTKIAGIIDCYGAVHSKTSEADLLYHVDEFGHHSRKSWRWSFQTCFQSSIRNQDDEIDLEEWDKIRRHLTRKYGIEWWDNGYHNIDQFIKQNK